MVSKILLVIFLNLSRHCDHATWGHNVTPRLTLHKANKCTKFEVLALVIRYILDGIKILMGHMM